MATSPDTSAHTVSTWSRAPKGTVTLPPHRNTLAFQNAVPVGKSIPAKVLFEFTAAPNWHKRADPLTHLTIVDKKYAEDANSSTLWVTLGNTDVFPLDGIKVYAVLYDKDSNAIGFSKTVVDEIGANNSVLAPFTWPITRHGAIISIEVLPVKE